jgi:uncharacterized protein
MNEDLPDWEDYPEEARLFPLPNLVFFPNVVQPLHIFEPRYRQMMADALEGDRLIALVLLEPDWEKDYDGRPPIHQIACLGKIVADQLLPDGRYNLILRGVTRIRILEEISTDRLYRVARIEPISDDVDAEVDELMDYRQKLSSTILPHFGSSTIREQIEELFAGEIPLGSLCDILAFALPIPIEVKQSMLEEISVMRRAQLLLEGFESVVRPQPVRSRFPGNKFPPDFSMN